MDKLKSKKEIDEWLKRNSYTLNDLFSDEHDDMFSDDVFIDGWSINNDLTVDAKSSVYLLGNSKPSTLPFILRNIDGDFSCHRIELETEEGLPHKIKGTLSLGGFSKEFPEDFDPTYDMTYVSGEKYNSFMQTRLERESLRSSLAPTTPEQSAPKRKMKI